MEQKFVIRYQLKTRSIKEEYFDDFESFTDGLCEIMKRYYDTKSLDMDDALMAYEAIAEGELVSKAGAFVDPELVAAPIEPA